MPTKHRSPLIPILAALLLPAALLAQPTAPAELTIEEAIRRALTRGFELEIQRYGPQIAEDAIVIARDPFRPTITASTSRSLSRSAPSTATGPGERSEFSDTRVGISQRLYTGATVSASTSLDRSASNPAVSALNPAYTADVSLSVRQPLLAGFGLAVNRAAINRAEIGLQRAHLDYRARALDIINSTENAFYNLAFAREQLEVRRSSLGLAQRLHDEAGTRRSTGVATELDVLQAEVGVANARRNVLLAEQAVRDRSDQLLELIGQFELDAPLGPTRLGELDTAVPVFASSLQAAKQNQPDFLSAQAALEQARLDLEVTRSNTKPDLTLGGALGLNGRNGRGGSALSDALEREDAAWQFDLSLSYPWGQKGDKARYRQAQAQITQQVLRLKQLEQAIEVDVRAAVRAVETNIESVGIATLASRLSEKQYELEKARFDAGLSTSRRVLEAQTDLESARVSELQSRVSLRTALAALHRIEGSSLARFGLQLP
ncbi:MAG TPA: TolC family protein [Opitutaceae bacterium]|nr:TolC family protein [Opitutaceae bacterium]